MDNSGGLGADRRAPRRYGPNAEASPAPRMGQPYNPRPAWSEADATRAYPRQAPAPYQPHQPYNPPPAGQQGPTGPGGRPPLPPVPPPVLPPRPGSGEPPRRTPGGVIAGRVIAMLVAASLLIGVGIAWFVTDRVQTSSGTSDAAANAGQGGVTFEGGMTILLVGSDARTDADGNPLSEEELSQVATEDDGGGVNTDTMMLVHVPEGGGKATAVSLPRDTWISSAVTGEVTGPYADGSEGEYQPNKINSYYATAKAYTEQRLVNEGVTDSAEIERVSNEAGRTMLIRIIQAFTGMKIDHYAEVNLLGFYLLSNAIGGVPVCLNAAVDDPWSGAVFPAGEQEVQGTAALSFVRQRHGLPGGDLDRVRRQQAFLAGAADKILSVGTLTDPSRLNELVGAVDRSVTFDKGFSVLSFAEQMTNLSSGNINFETLPTRGAEQSTDTDALATDPAEVDAFFQAIVGGGDAADGAVGSTASSAPIAVDPASVTVDVQDGTIADGVTAFATETVNDAGFSLGSTDVVPGTAAGNETARTVLLYPSGGEANAEAVRDAFGAGTLQVDNSVEDGHVLVVVGTDLQIPGNRLHSGGAFFAPPAAAAAVEQAAAASSLAVPCVN